MRSAASAAGAETRRAGGFPAFCGFAHPGRLSAPLLPGHRGRWPLQCFARSAHSPERGVVLRSAAGPPRTVAPTMFRAFCAFAHSGRLPNALLPGHRGRWPLQSFRAFCAFAHPGRLSAPLLPGHRGRWPLQCFARSAHSPERGVVLRSAAGPPRTVAPTMFRAFCAFAHPWRLSDALLPGRRGAAPYTSFSRGPTTFLTGADGSLPPGARSFPGNRGSGRTGGRSRSDSGPSRPGRRAHACG